MSDSKFFTGELFGGTKTRTIGKVCLHILLWVTLFSLPLLFRPYPTHGDGPQTGPYSLPIPMPILMNDLFLMLAFYVNLYVLMPLFLNKKKWGIYIACMLIFLVGSLYVNELSRFIENLIWPDYYENLRKSMWNSFHDAGGGGSRGQWPREGGSPGGFRGSFPNSMNRGGESGGFRERNFVFRNFSFIYMFMMIWFISMASYMFKLLQASVRHADKVLSTALQSELSFLKAQINPHFLFNTLNNIYVLTLKKSEKAPAAVMKLSNLMRTLTNDTGVDYVSFSEEEQFIRDYLELQEMRLTETTKVKYEISGDFSNLKVAPRILLPFIDNAFKYGVSNRYESEILIRLNFNGTVMESFIQNAIHRDNTDNLGSSGIGVSNSTRRLELLYANRYDLKIEESDNLHKVTLNIDLQ